MIIVRTLQGVRSHFKPRMVEWLLTAFLLVIAEAFLLPGDSFAGSVAFTYMASYGPDWAWGLFMGTIGLIRLFALIMNGSFEWFKRYSPTARSLGAVFSLVPWAVLWISVLLSNVWSPGWQIFLLIFLSDAVLALMVAREAGQNESKYRNGST